MSKKSNVYRSSAWVQGDIRLAGALDSRMIGLLRAIDATGSINQAAKQAGLSYKGAWQMIERANNFSPKVLVSTATGGVNGGGTSLTSAGRALLELFTRIEQQHNAFLQNVNQMLEADTEMLLLLKPLTIKTSATNQLFGTVSAIHCGAVNAEVAVQLKGGEQIVASLALTELSALGLDPGQPVLMLINSPEISLMTDTSGFRLSARNHLQGTVIRVHQDAVDCEVAIRLPGDDSIVASLTRISAAALDLRPGVAVNAIFKSNAVMIAANNN
ncbi:MAG: TOBE domain-containing protein [Methylococcales bacterium]|nr:TOBE domain-containing protein [Methylococcales bacterium]